MDSSTIWHLRFLFGLKTFPCHCGSCLYCTGHIHVNAFLDVRLQMPFEVGELCEALLAIVALVRLGIKMPQLVLLKVDQLREVTCFYL